jgi:hypothetical protein
MATCEDLTISALTIKDGQLCVYISNGHPNEAFVDDNFTIMVFAVRRNGRKRCWVWNTTGADFVVPQGSSAAACKDFDCACLTAPEVTHLEVVGVCGDGSYRLPRARFPKPDNCEEWTSSLLRMRTALAVTRSSYLPELRRNPDATWLAFAVHNQAATGRDAVIEVTPLDPNVDPLPFEDLLEVGPLAASIAQHHWRFGKLSDVTIARGVESLIVPPREAPLDGPSPRMRASDDPGRCPCQATAARSAHLAAPLRAATPGVRLGSISESEAASYVLPPPDNTQLSAKLAVTLRPHQLSQLILRIPQSPKSAVVGLLRVKVSFQDGDRTCERENHLVLSVPPYDPFA